MAGQDDRAMHHHWAKAPPGTRIYAIGDMHGRLDLLDAMHGMIRLDASTAGGARVVVVYLGDYVDRGPDSRGLVDRLLGKPLAPFETVYLKGNHEDLMLEFLLHGTRGASWLVNGGDVTLASYDVPPPSPYAEDEHAAARAALIDRLPSRHRAFFGALRLRHREGDYLFVHAGIRPGVALEAQQERDLIWIREQFLDCDDAFGVCVVHGHTIAPAPTIKNNRIGLDTGAYRSGRLSCAVLEGDTVRILQT